jgi:phosphonate transport system permease protein
MSEGAGADRDAKVRRLKQACSRDPFIICSVILLAALVSYAWLAGGFSISDLASAKRLENLHRFARELLPFPLQSQSWDWGSALQWFGEVVSDNGLLAVGTTLAISVVAILCAAICGLALALFAARTLATAEPYLPNPRPSPPLQQFLWSACMWMTRSILIFVRAVPEYVWAFLLIAVIGPNVWAAVLALALHNSGILGKLNAEVIENLQRESLAALRGLGARRRQIILAAVVPTLLPRFLLLILYRWESCVREATVLGMLGIVSLGYFIQDARARQQYDVVLALILVGGLIVLLGDVLSALGRALVRRS